MRKTLTLAAFAAAALSLATAACNTTGPTEARAPSAVSRDGDPPPPDTTKQCEGGMIGSGTATC